MQLHHSSVQCTPFIQHTSHLSVLKSAIIVKYFLRVVYVLILLMHRTWKKKKSPVLECAQKGGHCRFHPPGHSTGGFLHAINPQKEEGRHRGAPQCPQRKWREEARADRNDREGGEEVHNPLSLFCPIYQYIYFLIPCVFMFMLFAFIKLWQYC